MSLLKRLKLSHAITVSTLLPMLVALITLYFLILNLNIRIDQQRATEDIVVLSELLDAVAHNHAVERGLTAGFSGAKGQKGQEALSAQRLKAEAAGDALLDFNLNELKVFPKEDANRLIEPVAQLLSERARTRTKVDQLASDNNAFNYYSTLNREALLGIERLLLKMTDLEASSLMNARLQLLWMKERAGQVRGALNGIFSAGSTSDARQAVVSSFLADEADRMKLFQAEAPEVYQATLSGFLNTSIWKSVAKASQTFVAAIDLTQIKGPANWFDIATQRIGNIKTLSDQVGQDLYLTAQEKTQALVFTRLALVVLFVVVMLPVLILGVLVRRSISTRVATINKYLTRISQEKVFNESITDSSMDEISAIIAALDIHVKDVQQDLLSIAEQANASFDRVSEIKQGSDSVLTESKIQFEKTDQIATAMEELSQANQVISQDMQAAVTETANVQQQGKEGSQRVQHIMQSIEELDREINQTYQIVEQVSENTSGINQILQTIESIAEQTNLLALNAAIEAARAGEQGRGFAVVADEVRSLASRTQDSTVEIRTMISNLVESSTKAIESMEHCKTLTDGTAEKVGDNADMIQSLFASMDRLNESIEKVAHSAQEQSRVSDDVNQNVQQMTDGSQTIVAASEQSYQTVQELAGNLQDVHQNIARYKL